MGEQYAGSRLGVTPLCVGSSAVNWHVEKVSGSKEMKGVPNSMLDFLVDYQFLATPTSMCRSDNTGYDTGVSSLCLIAYA